jgi:Holliday junction DNA helicase RuvA
MIALLTGRLAFKAPTHLALDVHGVGYEVFIPLSTYYNVPNVNDSLSLSIHTHVREDAIQLFGFSTPQEKDAFVLLLSVSGIGPKSALGISFLPSSLGTSRNWKRFRESGRNRQAVSCLSSKTS